MTFGSVFRFVILALGGLGLVDLCFESTQPIHIAGPMNMSFAGDPTSTLVGLMVLGSLTSVGIWKNYWPLAQRLVCIIAAAGIVVVMVVHHSNLSDDVYWKTDGQFDHANIFSFWLFTIPALILFTVAYARFRHRKDA